MYIVCYRQLSEDEMEGICNKNVRILALNNYKLYKQINGQGK